MGHGMCRVPLMPMVMKFSLTHYGTLYEQFCDIESQWEKLVEGQLWAEVIQVMIWSHVKVLPICPESNEIIFFWVSYFILLLFCAQIDEGSLFLGTI